MSRLGALNDEFMKRLAPKVAGFFPVIPGELLEDYGLRARIMTEDQRAMIAAYIGVVSEEIQAERQAKKSAWIAAARLTFSPGPRQPCAICGKYLSLTEAHHIVPLGIQYDAGAVEPINEHRWLCPTHHAAEHVIIAALINTTQPNLEGMPIEERDAMCNGPASTRFIELAVQLPNFLRLSKSFRDAEAYLRDPERWTREQDE